MKHVLPRQYKDLKPAQQALRPHQAPHHARGAFCFGLLIAACGFGPGKASQTPFVSKPHDFFGLGSEP
jgi:hypothetical protein